MKTPHKHAELIKAWADGAQIQYEDEMGRWYPAENPSWNSRLNYRIKPIPKVKKYLYTLKVKDFNPRLTSLYFTNDEDFLANRSVDSLEWYERIHSSMIEE